MIYNSWHLINIKSRREATCHRMDVKCDTLFAFFRLTSGLWLSECKFTPTDHARAREFREFSSSGRTWHTAGLEPIRGLPQHTWTICAGFFFIFWVCLLIFFPFSLLFLQRFEGIRKSRGKTRFTIHLAGWMFGPCWLPCWLSCQGFLNGIVDGFHFKRNF